MTPLCVFLRSLARSSAVCLGVGLVVANPSLEWSGPPQATAQKGSTQAAVDALSSALSDADPLVRTYCVRALGRVRHGGAIAALAAALQNPSVHVRREAITALNAIGDAAARSALASALGDDDDAVRHLAGRSLDRLAAPE